MAIEIFAPREHPDIGECYFTLRSIDVGKASILTEIGRVELRDMMGYVTPRDVGKRLYRFFFGGSWVWMVENNDQYQRRLLIEHGRGERHEPYPSHARSGA